jgi:ADP-ribose pyrophosphatase
MSSPISQVEYVIYTRCLEDIKVIEQCCRKGQLSRIGFLKGRFVKLLKAEEPLNYKTIFDKLPPDQLNELTNKITYVNRIHNKLEEGELSERNIDDCTPLAAEFYNTHLKTISAWNEVFQKEELHIHLPNGKAEPLETTFFGRTLAQRADEKALARYFELLNKYPKLRRAEGWNDYQKGTYQMVYTPNDILTIHKEIYQRLYSKAKSQGLTHAQAEELAVECSRPGVVCEDQFWLWIRDVVISPKGYKHTYNRIVWKSDLERVGGAAALPVLIDNKETKIVIQLAFRHATNSWELEMPRGGSELNETALDTAKREVREETGYETNDLFHLGVITPDSGLTASVIPIFLGKVTLEKKTNQDKTEAIKGKYAFTVSEVMNGFKRGYMEVDINGRMTQVPIRDPFLAYALLMAQYHGQLSSEFAEPKHL